MGYLKLLLATSIPFVIYIKLFTLPQQGGYLSTLLYCSIFWLTGDYIRVLKSANELPDMVMRNTIGKVIFIYICFGVVTFAFCNSVF
jgi:hypothetical protein